ncbi:hypothetical protein [Quadrisphaera sp. DSM 44207]|uniref:hypothetical protein n=1 Tax=Quadrisphaera sp. DSM 44207 TaxID=1881057 RepID=UPI000890040D|nr:hypothetical protein SAMN05428996_1806 [Quadrisphaera sp. DSM 44207]
MFVLTVDQRNSRAEPDRVEELLEQLAGAPGLVRPFERTAGDEVQGVLDDPAAVVDLALRLVRTGRWSVGVGAGAVREPLPASTRAGAGPAFEHARDAVERAKTSTPHVAVSGDDPASAAHAEAVLRLLGEVVQRRTDAGWEVVDLLQGGATQTDVAARLGITKQAVSQRAHAGGWPHERDVRPVAAALLDRAQDAREAP